MFIYLLRRLIYVLPVAIGVSLICFLLVHIAPGDPLTAIMPVDATQEQQAAMRSAYGLDKPLPVQYGIWVGKVVTGDLGKSIATGRPVAQEVFGAVKNSMLLAFMASLIAFPIGLTLGFRVSGGLSLGFRLALCLRFCGSLSLCFSSALGFGLGGCL
ncbi:MAG: ABC transporter permease, partial [Pannonibacter indicus]